MSQNLTKSEIEDHVKNFNAKIDRQDEIYARFGGILLTIGALVLVSGIIVHIFLILR